MILLLNNPPKIYKETKTMSIVQSQKRFKVGDTAYYYDYKNDKPAKLIVLEVTKFGYRKVKLENGEIEPWFDEMLTLDELYNRHKQIFTDNYESAKNLCLAWGKNLRELNSFYKKEKENA